MAIDSGVVNGKAVPASVARNTILITDHNTFRFPKASSAGTNSAGHFTINPNTTPKQVDSVADSGPNAGQVSRGIYEIPDPTHQRACFGPLGGPRPTEFKSSSGSGRILQNWKKIGPVQSRYTLSGPGICEASVTLKATPDAYALRKLAQNRIDISLFRTKCFWSAMRPRIAFAKRLDFLGTPHRK